MLYEAFAGSVLPSVQKLGSDAEMLQKENKLFSLAKLQEIWGKFRETAGRFSNGAPAMSLVKFRKFMVDNFDISASQLPLMNNLFEAFDTDKSGTIQWNEMFAGLTQLVSGDDSAKAEFYFTLFDRDSNGELQSHEVLHALLNSRMNAEDSAEEVTSLLQQLDQNGDGVITVEEFREAATTNPALLEAFGTLFGATKTSTSGPKEPRTKKSKAMDKLVTLLRDETKGGKKGKNGKGKAGAGGGAGGGAGAGAGGGLTSIRYSPSRHAHACTTLSC